MCYLINGIYYRYAVLGTWQFSAIGCSAFCQDRNNCQQQYRSKARTVADEIRYGKDTLPQGDRSKAAGLSVGDKQTLQVTTDQKNGVLYVFAKRLYEARSNVKIGIRIPGFAISL